MEDYPPQARAKYVMDVDTVILAMGAGRNAAEAIDAYLKDGQW